MVGLIYLYKETSKLGMEINENKTKYMVTSTYEHSRSAVDLRIGNKIFEAVQSFQYLGNIIGNTNSNNKYIKERIMMGNKALLTPWSRVLLEKLTVNFEASQEIPRIYGTRKSLTVHTSAHQQSVSCTNSIQSLRLPPTS
jgi:hypothetical protein